MKQQRRHIHRHQEGQVMVLTVLMVLVILAGILAGYDLARLVLARIKFQNGADAVALTSVAVKVDKHHFDTVWRWAMQQEAYIGQLEATRAKAYFVKTVLDVQNNKPGYVPLPGPVPMPGPGGPQVPAPGPPGTPPGSPPQKLLEAKEAFALRANKAHRHAAKVHQMDKTLLSLYNDWPRHFRETVNEAAVIAWRMNIGGFERDRSPEGVQNINLVRHRDDILSDNHSSTGSPGGIIYRNEGPWANGTFGKTMVEMHCGVQPLFGGAAFVGLLPTYAITVNAGAQPIAVAGTSEPKTIGQRYVSQHDVSLAKSPLTALDDARMQWHQPALFSLRGDDIKPGQGGRFAGPLH